MMKNAFCFTLKAPFSRYLSFCHDFWSSGKNCSIRKFDKKQLKYAYCPISQEVKATRQ